MLRVIRWVSEKTGRSECELKSELCEEIREWEAEVKAMSKMMAAEVAPKKKAASGKKKGADAEEVKKAPETQGAQGAEEEPKEPEAVAVAQEAPKKKAAAKKKKAPEAVAQEAQEAPEAGAQEAPKKKAAAKKKKAPEAGVVEGETEAKAPKKKAAAKKKKEEPEAQKAPEVEWNVKVVVTKDEEEEEEVEVEEMEYNGVKYLKSSRGVVYDIETSEEVGRWNEETKSIESD
jgi:hypothetical protein